MVDAEMVKEVKDLIAEGYTPEKVKANLVKIGFSEKEVGELMAEASAGAPAKAPPEPAAKPVGATAAQPAPEPAAQPPPEPAAQPIADEGLEGLGLEEPASEEDLLLAAGGDIGPAELPEVEHPPEAPAEAPAEPPKEEHVHGRRHHRPKPAAPEPKPPEVMRAEGEEPEEKPKTGAGKAIVIFLLAFVVILVLAYFIAFPKLGITLF